MYVAVVETLETYRSVDELKELVRRHGRGPVRIVALKRFAGFPAERTGFKAI